VEREIVAGFKVEEEEVRLFGRTALDYKRLYEKFEQENKASYALAYIAEEEELDEQKLEYEGSLYDLYRNDFSFFLQYNMIDTEVLIGLERKKQYIQLALQSSHMATGQVGQIYGTIKLAELAIINYCHYELNKRIPDSKKHDYFSKYGGAFVLDCQQGEHKMIGSVDVESLYPTGIMSINASPETIIGQFQLNENAFQAISDQTDEHLEFIHENGDMENRTTEEWGQYFIDNDYTLSGYGTVFEKNKKGVIPAILEIWFAERREYKKELAKYEKLLDEMDESDSNYKETKEKKDFYYRLQHIKKIQLNSLYGCMGNKFFKFFDIRLAESTTKTGREILFHMVKQIGKELDGAYQFPTDSVVYGDTDSCYFKTHVDNIDDAKRVCRYIENAINKSFPDFMKSKFFCDSENAKRARVENEIISDIGIFVSKKIYLLHLVYKEGYDTDEMKVMGHAIKKTVLTKIVKETLTNILEQYFKTHDWKQLNLDVVKFKKMLEKTEAFEDYGLPKKINKIEEYEENYRKDPTCRISGGQAAAMFWNICLDTYEDHESLRAKSQMSYRTYYLEKSFGRFSSVAVPTDLLVIPDWFKENFIPIIDKDRQIGTLVDKTLTNICEAIGKQIPTDKAVLADEILVY
jgi:DNA polymerase elongation subunit (family B)